MAWSKNNTLVSKDTFEINLADVNNPEVQQRIINFFVDNIDSREIEIWTQTNSESVKEVHFRSRDLEEESDVEFKQRLTENLNMKLSQMSTILSNSRELEELINTL